MPMKIKLEEKEEIEKMHYELVGLSKNPFHPDPDPPDFPKECQRYQREFDNPRIERIERI